MEFCDNFLINRHLYSSIVYVDESGFNLWTKRTNGRSLKGQPAVRVSCGSKGKNLSLILSISSEVGVVYSQFVSGSVNRDIFKNYLEHVSASLNQQDRCLVILDNASIHRNVTLSNPLHEVHFLPPYSPFLNPIEESFSAWKYQVKLDLSSPDCVNRLNDNVAAAVIGSNMQEYRRGILEEIGNSALSVITREKVNNWYQHSLSFFPRCQRKEDL